MSISDNRGRHPEAPEDIAANALPGEANDANESNEYPYRPKRVLTAYLIISAFLLVFGLIYEYFSHGVYTAYMIFAFAIPLVMGVPFALLFMLNKKAFRPGEYSRSIYRWACALLTGGSIIKGVLIIYGTDSILTRIYFILGALALAVSAGVYIREAVLFKKKATVK